MPVSAADPAADTIELSISKLAETAIELMEKAFGFGVTIGRHGDKRKVFFKGMTDDDMRAHIRKLLFDDYLQKFADANDIVIRSADETEKS